MKVKFKTEAVDIEVDGKDTKDVFVQLASAVEVFSHTTCGNCSSHHTVPVVREVNGNTYHEMRCLACGACLAFGQKRADGSLFPKRKDKDGNWLDNTGWVKFRRQDPVSDFD
jgi:hypothetical protein